MKATEQRTYLSVDEFVKALGGRLSRNSTYSAIGAGTIPHVRIGKRILVPSDALDKLLEFQRTDSRRVVAANGSN